MEGKVMLVMKHQHPEVFAKLPDRISNLTIIRKNEHTAKVIYFDQVSQQIDWEVVKLDNNGLRIGNNLPIQADRIDLQSVVAALSFAIH